MHFSQFSSLFSRFLWVFNVKRMDSFPPCFYHSLALSRRPLLWANAKTCLGKGYMHQWVIHMLVVPIFRPGFYIYVCLFSSLSLSSAESCLLHRYDCPPCLGADMPRGRSSSTNFLHRDGDDDADIDDFRLAALQGNFTQGS